MNRFKMARKKYITSHSNYVLKKQHSITNDGTIYERDYMTLTPLNTVAPNQIQIYGEGNFKLSVGDGVNRRIKHNYGEWEVFSPSSNSNEISRESKIVLNPNYSSLLDFAYYGSCVSLIETTIINIIKNYPGELYFSDRQLLFIDGNGNNIKLGGDNMYIIENPFLIDILDDSIENADNIKSFLSCIDKYNVITNANDFLTIIDYEKAINEINTCLQNNDKVGEVKLTLSDDSEIVLYVYFYEGEYYTMYDDINYKKNHIRLKEVEIDKIFKNFSDFEKILLNRESKPLYKAILDTPRETPNGIVISKKSYILPTNGGWNIDVTSTKYSTYLNDLLSIATFYDEYYTDNIWRMLTHTSIKNMDNSFVSLKNDENIDDFILGGGRVEKILKVYGRQYDDIKRYIQNIKVSNNITYDRKNNIPDYFLTDKLNMSGWEVTNVAPIEDTTIRTDVLFPNSENKEYNCIDANINFLRHLNLNSKYISSLKGTKLGIETILKLFGLTINDFEINEYVAIADNKSTIIEPDVVKLYNKYKKMYNDENTNLSVEDELQGLPVKEVIYEKNGDINRYLIPWFDKNLYYDGEMYFQMNGGWGKTTEKKIKNKKLTNVEILKDTIIYDETVKYLHFVDNVEDLTKLNIRNISTGDVYYVYNLSNIETLYKDSNNTIPNDGYSNYFILKNIDYSYILGKVDEKEGWINISTQSLEEGNSADAKKIIYLESIIEDNKGNAPHIGYGNYDDGKEYLDYFRQLFKYSIENDEFIEDSEAYSCDTGDLVSDIIDAGFIIGDNCIDNIKCWYFSNTNNSNVIQKLIYNINNDTYVAINDDIIDIEPNENGKWDKNIYTTFIEPVNFENIFNSDDEDSLEKYDEAAANSIINIKNMSIIIKNKDENFIDYFNDKIMPYLKQMIPSSTIWEVKFE